MKENELKIENPGNGINVIKNSEATESFEGKLESYRARAEQLLKQIYRLHTGFDGFATKSTDRHFSIEELKNGMAIGKYQQNKYASLRVSESNQGIARYNFIFYKHKPTENDIIFAEYLVAISRKLIDYFIEYYEIYEEDSITVESILADSNLTHVQKIYNIFQYVCRDYELEEPFIIVNYNGEYIGEFRKKMNMTEKLVRGYALKLVYEIARKQNWPTEVEGSKISLSTSWVSMQNDSESEKK